MPRLRPLVVAALAGLAALPATGSAAPAATGVTLAGRAAYEQVVVTFAGGRLTGLEREVDAPDVTPGDGRAVVRVNGRGLGARSLDRARAGVTVRLRRRPGNALVLLDAPPGRFKFVQYRIDGSRTRLVVRLWRATTSARARVLDDGCLRMTAVRGGRTAAARGLELQPLFEHGLVLSLRGANAGDDTIGLLPLTASGGVFRPGLVRPGRWAGGLAVALGGPVGAPPTQVAMLEAWSGSAKDGSLECLVQAPVVLRP